MTKINQYSLQYSLKKGEQKAYVELYKKYYSLLCVYANRYVKDIDTSEEIVQEVIYKIFEKRESLDIPEKIEAYLYASVKNTCLNYIKHKKIEQEYVHNSLMFFQNNLDSFSDNIPDNDFYEKVESAINALPEKCQQAFRLSRFQGLKYKEIADQMDISVKGVEFHMSKAMKHLYKALHEFLPILIMWISSALMKKFIALFFIFITFTTNGQVTNNKAIQELERHIELGNLSEPISEKLRIYFTNGGELDDSDWLYFLQSGINDIEEISISEFIENRNREICITRYELINNLLDAGFVLDINNFDNKTYRVSQKEVVEISANIALKDYNKSLLKDLEADVMKGNNAYIQFIKQLSSISNGVFNPEELYEEWVTETGPIIVKFNYMGLNYIFEPEYLNDWLDGSFIKKINNELSNQSCGFYTIRTDYETGQGILILFLKIQEKEILEHKLKWQLVKL